MNKIIEEMVFIKATNFKGFVTVIKILYTVINCYKDFITVLDWRLQTLELCLKILLSDF